MILAAGAFFATLQLAAAVYNGEIHPIMPDDPKDGLRPNLPDPDAPVEIKVTTGDANKEIKAKVGEIIVVELDSYGADNYYLWSETPGRSDTVLENEEKDQKVRDYAIGMARVGDKSVFRYLVKAPGKTELTFGCGRPWEKDKPPVSSFNVKIVAEAADAKAAPATEAKATPAAAKTYNMTKDDNGKTLKIKVGDVIRVKLKSNRTTGYSWALNGKTDEKVLKSGEVEYKVDEHPAGMVGVGGNDFCTFTAIAAGKTEIALGYARPWEKDKDPAQSFKLTVEVEAAAAPAGEAKADAKAAAAPAKAEIRLTDKDNGKTVKVAVDGTVIISLDSNATTGFSWTKADKVDREILKLEKNDYMQSANPNGLVGVGGTTVIVYKALKKGKAKIGLTYMQPWEPDSKFNTNFSVTVEVE
jgi:inhibitor of cysteine peptidase